ncbi:MAG: NAD-dependent deacylase [Bacteroidetes bacterium]|jgi:NAD-dependent deacetylase|nr:NAD-dependent deacylase [Bacteroidota bacterium]
MAKKKLVVFTGAGISAESGIKTFRDSGGLWEEYKIEDVATPSAWKKDPTLVTQFYNLRRKQVMEAKPNAAHYFFAELQNTYDVLIITQNIDDLHERAGSKNVLHLHGEIMKVRSTLNENLIYDLKKWEVKMGDKCEKGSQLRPHIVWFGEMVPNMDKAVTMVQEAEIFVTVGTSLNVYPAAGLVEIPGPDVPKYILDPGTFDLKHIANLTHIREKAGDGVKQLGSFLVA